jgi:hypothetical protein
MDLTSSNHCAGRRLTLFAFWLSKIFKIFSPSFSLICFNMLLQFSLLPFWRNPVSFVKAAVYLCVTRWCRSFRLFTSGPRNCSAISGFWLSRHHDVPPHKVKVGILRHPTVLSCLATSNVFGNDRILLLHAAFIYTWWGWIYMAVQNDVILYVIST